MNASKESTALARPDTGDETTRLKDGIAQTRADMSETITALETRLTSSEVREKVEEEIDHVKDRVRELVKEQLGEAKEFLRTDAKEFVRTELDEAEDRVKNVLGEAEERVKKGLVEAKESAKQEVKEAFTGAKRAVREATLGKVEDLATDIGDKMNETRETLVDTVRNNPIPAALVGVGIAWLLMNRSRSASSSRGARSNGRQYGWNDDPGWGGERYGDNGRSAGASMTDRMGEAVGEAGSAVENAAHKVKDAVGNKLHQASDAAGEAMHDASETAKRLAHKTGDTVSGMAHKAGDTVSGMAHKAGDTVSHLAHDAGGAAASVARGAKRGVMRVERGFEDTMETNPIALGAAALGIGVVVGYALPRTEREDAFMGEARDEVLHKAGEVIHDAAASMAQLAEKGASAAKAALPEAGASQAR